ncbi:MAG: DUF4292 domain-containing protein [Desulfobulbaceae bacterium]|nr:DUF4292 domain-containing protein [Desulfobulbaceae bacterium]
MAKISSGERDLVAKEYEQLRQRQDACHCCIDVAVAVTLKGLLHSGTVSGYLQAMSPAFLRFTGLNPLGQPLMILVSDGDFFQYLAVDRGTGYTGNVKADTFVKYAPAGFRPPESFYWLTGRLPSGAEVVEVAGRALDPEKGYWIVVQAGEQRRRLLFDPDKGVILRHQVLDGDGDDIFDARYEDFRAAGEKGCILPGRITVTTRQHSGTLQIELSDWLDDADLSVKDFAFSLPPGFVQVEVP